MSKARTLQAVWYWDIPAVGRLPIGARLLYAGLHTHCADDEGRAYADPEYLRAKCFAYNRDIEADEVQAWLDLICLSCPDVTCYEVRGQRYIELADYANIHQIRYVVKSKLPGPDHPNSVPVSPGENCGNLVQISENSRNFVESAENSRLSRVGLGRVGLGSNFNNSNELLKSEKSSLTGSEGNDPGESKPRKGRGRGRPRKTVANNGTDGSEGEDRATTLPKDWAPEARELAWLDEQEAEDWVDVQAQYEAFVDYFTEGDGKGKRKKSWGIAFRNWLRPHISRAMDRGVKRPRPKGSTQGTLADPAVAAKYLPGGIYYRLPEDNGPPLRGLRASEGGQGTDLGDDEDERPF